MKTGLIRQIIHKGKACEATHPQTIRQGQKKKKSTGHRKGRKSTSDLYFLKVFLDTQDV